MNLLPNSFKTWGNGILCQKSRSIAYYYTQPMQTQITTPHFLTSILRTSINSRYLPIGKMAHSCILKSGLESNLLLVNNLLHLYTSCLSTSDAWKLFNEMPERDVVSWNTMISGSAGIGCFKDGFSYYCQMKCAGVCPSQSSFVSVLKASVEMGSLGICRQVHGESFKYGLSSDLLVGNALLTTYVKLGEMKKSMAVFEGMHEFDEISIEILLRGYLHQGSSVCDAFELFRYSFVSHVPFSCYALSSLLSLCSSVDGFDHGVQIHGYIVKDGLSTNVSIVNSLITMYARLYYLDDAVCLFEDASSRDIVTWNSLIAGYAFNSRGEDGLGLLGWFMSSGMRLNESTFSSLLSCCATVTSLESAKEAHALIIKLRESKDVGIDNIILTMYCKRRSLDYASRVFNVLDERDAVSYNLMTGLFRNHGWYEESMRVLHLIQLEGFKVDEFTYSSLISSCSRLVDLEVGQQIHGCIMKTGFDMILPLGNSLLEMYSQCGQLKDMEKIVSEIDAPDVFTWNIMVMAYTSFGFFDKSFKLWGKMKESGVDLNEFSYCAMIDTCSYVEAPLVGEQIHARIKKLGLGSDTTLMNSMITMYSSCEKMEKASIIFEEIPLKDYVSWNALICGCAQNGFTEEAVKFYVLMNFSGFKPNDMTFASIFKCCAHHSMLLLSLQFHAEVIKTGFESDVAISNSIITMYAKCGELGDSIKTFQNTMNNRDVITWNSMISAFSHHGCGRQALDTIAEMKIVGVKPNAITFLGALSACGHSGLVSEACALFDYMSQEHGIVPSEEHYACMVDIYCRAGRLREAKELMESMPYKSCSFIWKTFLSGCRINENIELGEEAAKNLMQLEPHDSSAYVLLSNIYALAEKMEEKAETRRKMGHRSVRKDIGCSWISS